MAKDDRIEGISAARVGKISSMMLPRIDVALRLGHMDFVTHDSCQQVVREVFFGGKDLQKTGEDEEDREDGGGNPGGNPDGYVFMWSRFKQGLGKRLRA